MNKNVMIILLFLLATVAGAVLALERHPSTVASRSSRIRRTILIRFKSEVSPPEIQKVLREVKANISSLGGVHNVFVGAQIIDRVPFTYGISMDFDDEAALKAYRQDQEHRRTHNDYVHLIEQAQISDIRDE